MAYDRRGGWKQRKEIVSIFWHIYSSAAALFLSTGSRSFFFWFQFSQHPLSACCVWQWSFQEEGFNIPSPLTSTRRHPRAPQVCLQAKCIHCGCYANTVSNEPPVILPPMIPLSPSLIPFLFPSHLTFSRISLSSRWKGIEGSLSSGFVHNVCRLFPQPGNQDRGPLNISALLSLTFWR